MQRRLLAASLLVLSATGMTGRLLLAQRSPGERWVGAWSTAVTWRPPVASTASTPSTPPLVPQTPASAGAATPSPNAPRPIAISNQTLREIVRPTIGGDRVRVVFSNAFGTLPVRIGAASIAARADGPSLVAGSAKPLTFDGQPGTTIPAGAMLISDPASVAAAALTDLAVDVYLPDDLHAWMSPLTMHNGAFQTSYLSGDGNHAGETTLQAPTTTTSWFLLSRVEVLSRPDVSAIVAVGDSITDGTRSTVDRNGRWPDELARRLQAQPATRHFSVLNAGIAGNRVLTENTPERGINVLARFDRDALDQSGVKYVVVMEGINDIGNLGGAGKPAPTAAQIIAGHRQLIERAHARGVTIFGATLTPFEGAAYFTPEGEVTRRSVNEWIRTSHAYDGVIDFDAVIRDPANPSKFLPAYNSGDSLHPNDAGYKAMGQAVDLKLFH